jgi:hypothetical protein
MQRLMLVLVEMGWIPGTMLGASPPEIVPMLNVVKPNSGDEAQVMLIKELRQTIRRSIAEMPSSG